MINQNVFRMNVTLLSDIPECIYRINYKATDFINFAQQQQKIMKLRKSSGNYMNEISKKAAKTSLTGT